MEKEFCRRESIEKIPMILYNINKFYRIFIKLIAEY